MANWEEAFLLMKRNGELIAERARLWEYNRRLMGRVLKLAQENERLRMSLMEAHVTGIGESSPESASIPTHGPEISEDSGEDTPTDH